MIVAFLLLTVLHVAFISPAFASCGHKSGCSRHLVRDPLRREVPVSTFSYGTITGPLNWHSLSEANFLCGHGKHQSPILLNSTSAVAPEGSVNLHIPFAHEAEFENLGTTVEVVMNGTLTAANRKWKLKQFHFHTPSEHRVDNAHYEAEVHFVFSAVDREDKTAVLAFFVEIDEVDSTHVFEHIFSFLGAIQTPGTATRIVNVDFSDFEQRANEVKYFHYTGSFTTPPCSEGVLWFIATTPIPLRVRTYVKLKNTTKTNNRNIQNVLGEENLLKVAAAGLRV